MTARVRLDLAAKWRWTLLLAPIVVVLVASGYGVYRLEAQRIRLGKYDELAAIGELKAGQIAQWRLERLNNASNTAESPFFVRGVEAWRRDPGNVALRDEFRERLEIEQRTQNYSDALLLNTDGSVLLAAEDQPDRTNAATMKAVAMALEGKQAVLSDLFRSSDGEVYLDAVAPVSDANDLPIAVVILRSNATRFLYPLIQSWPIPSRSAETLLVQKEGDEILFLNELRHRAGAALSFRIPSTGSDLPAAQAVAGKQGLVEGEDYRGVEVLADLRPVPGSAWFMVAKVDSSEILAEVRYRAVVIALFVAVLILLSAVGVALLYRRRQVRLYRSLQASERERHKAGELLRESEGKFRALVEAIPDVIMRFDRAGRHLYVSPNVEEVVGIEAGKFIGKTHRELGFPDEMCTFWEETIRTAFDGGVPRETEFRFRAKRGPRVFNWRLTPERDEHGVVRSVLSISRDVTAYRRAEQDYQTLFREMLDGFAVHEIICDGEGRPVDYRFLAVNPTFERMTGLRGSEIVGKTVREVLPIIEERWIDVYGHVALTGEPVHFDIRSPSLDRQYEVSAFRPATNQFACIFLDTTERRRAEEALLSSGERHTAILRTAMDGFLLVDMEGRILEANDAYCRMSGYSEQELRSMAVWDVETTETASDVAAHTRRVETQGEDRFEGTHRRKDGSVFHVEVSVTYQPVEGGRVVTFIRDITERKRTEGQLREQARMNEILLDSFPCVALLLRPGTYEIVAMNRPAREAGCVLGATCFESWRKLKQPCPWCLAPPAWTTGEARQLEVEAHGIVWDAHWMPVSDDLYLHFAFDITERRRMERELLEKQRALIHAEKMASLGMLVTGVAHEVSSPNHSIALNASLLKDIWRDILPVLRDYRETSGDFVAGGLGAQQLEREMPRCIEGLAAASRHIDSIVGGLKSFAQAEESPQTGEVDLNRVVKAAQTLTANLLTNSTHSLRVRLQDGLPPVRGDFVRLEQVLINLIQNACEALRSPEEGIELWTSFDAEHGRVRVCVRDEGVGMSAEDLAKMKAPFFTKKRERGGLGLGVPISDSIVALHGGTLSYESQPGKGTTATIGFPVAARGSGATP